MLRQCIVTVATMWLLGTMCLAQTVDSAVVVKVSGDVKVEKTGGQPLPAAPDMSLVSGDKIRTGPASTVTLKLGDGNLLALKENSFLEIGAVAATEQPGTKPPPTLNLLSGTLLGRLKNVPRGGKVTIGTSTSMAGIEGTTFSVSASPASGESTVCVMEGAVLVESQGEQNKSVVVGARKMTRVSEWAKTIITATGAGVPSGRYRPIPVMRDNVQINVVRAMGSGATREEAEKKARDTLSGRLLRAKIGPEQSVADWLVGKDEVYERLAAFVAAAKVFVTTVLPDGSIEVGVEVNTSDFNRVLEQEVPIFEGAVVSVDEMRYSLTFGARERLTAERAATLDAQRKLLEIIHGVQITSQTTVQDFALQSDVIKSKVEGLLRGAETLKTEYFSDGTVEVTMCVRGPRLVDEINSAAKKDVLGRNYLSKPRMLDLVDYEQLRAFVKSFE